MYWGWYHFPLISYYPTLNMETARLSETLPNYTESHPGRKKSCCCFLSVDMRLK
jgi:hypothetical protein